jgi:sarcosine oxidase subunit alpha
MEDYLQTEWPQLKVYLTSITEPYAVIAVQGPKARQILEPVISGIDFGAFPHMAVRTGSAAGVFCRVFSVSFTGELGYEINVPCDYGLSVWEALLRQGERYGITPYGTEAMHVLRAEKGFIIVGQETDGTVTVADVGLARLIGKSKADFVGARSLLRPELASGGRKQLVGLWTADPQEILDEGAQIVADPKQAHPQRALGHVTSSYWSANCGRSIALAMLQSGRKDIGRKVYATTATGFTQVHVCEPVFVKGSSASQDGR